MPEQPSIRVNGYITELKNQIAVLSDRAAQYSAELAEVRMENELLKAQIKAAEKEQDDET